VGTQLTGSGSLSKVAGGIRVDAGVLELASGATSTSDLTVSGGTLVVNGPAPAGLFLHGALRVAPRERSEFDSRAEVRSEQGWQPQSRREPPVLGGEALQLKLLVPGVLRVFRSLGVSPRE
ncbi:MAG: hypothetical protein ACO3Y3_07560, partial [Phycisphaerales bacterium]